MQQTKTRAVVTDLSLLIWAILVALGALALIVLLAFNAYQDVQENHIVQQRLENAAQMEQNSHRETMFQSYVVALKSFTGSDGTLLVAALSFALGLLAGTLFGGWAVMRRMEVLE